VSTLPVGAQVTEVPKGSALLDLSGAIERLKLSWRSRLSLIGPKPHIHDFLRMARLADPARDIFECKCGARKAFAKNGSEVAVGRVLIDAGAIPLANTNLGGKS